MDEDIPITKDRRHKKRIIESSDEESDPSPQPKVKTRKRMENSSEEISAMVLDDRSDVREEKEEEQIQDVVNEDDHRIEEDEDSLFKGMVFELLGPEEYLPLLKHQIVDNGGKVEEGGIKIAYNLKWIRDTSYKECVYLRSYITKSIENQHLEALDDHTFEKVMSQAPRVQTGDRVETDGSSIFIKREYANKAQKYLKHFSAKGSYNCFYRHSQAGKSTFVTSFIVPNLQQQGFQVIYISAAGAVQDSFWDRLGREWDNSIIDVATFEKACFVEGKPKNLILIVDEIQHLKQETAKEFFGVLKLLKEKKHVHCLHSFSSIGLLSAIEQPTAIDFKYDVEHLFELSVYFSFQEAKLYRDEIQKWTGIYISIYVLTDIYGLTLGHPGFFAFIAHLITFKLRDTRNQLDLRMFRQMIVGKSFTDALLKSAIGKRIHALLRDDDKPLLSQLVGRSSIAKQEIESKNESSLNYLVEIGVLKETQNEEIEFVCPIMRSQVFDKLNPALATIEVTPPVFKVHEKPTQEAAYALVKHAACYLDRRHITSLANFKQHHIQQVLDPHARQVDIQYYPEKPLCPGEFEYQTQFDTVFNSGMLQGSLLTCFREWKEIEVEKQQYNFIDLVLRSGSTWGLIELVCFSTAADYEEHWEKLGGRYTDSYGSAAGQLVLLIIEDYGEQSKPEQVLQKDDLILTIWMRHDRLYSKVRFSSSLDGGELTEEFDIEAIQNTQKMKLDAFPSTYKIAKKSGDIIGTFPVFPTTTFAELITAIQPKVPSNLLTDHIISLYSGQDPNVSIEFPPSYKVQSCATAIVGSTIYLHMVPKPTEEGFL